MTDDSLIPLGPRIVVRHDAASDRSAGGLHLPETARDRQKPQEGTVLAVGPGRLLENGQIAPVDSRIVPGVRVLHTRYGGTEVNVDGNVVVVLQEADVLAVLKPSAVGTVAHHEFTHRSPSEVPSLRTHLQEGAVELPSPRKSFPVS